MENTQANKGISNHNANTQNVKNIEVVQPKVITKHKIVLEVAIRRKPGLIGIPGQDPAERVYRIGSSFDSRTRSNLKGVSDILEAKFLPSVIGVSPTAPEYRKAITEYWGSYSVTVPADEEILPPHQRGVKIKIEAHVNTVTKGLIEKSVGIKAKLQELNKALEQDSADIFDESINDYLLLNYALKYSAVAAKFEDIDKSPKILFYIYEKSIAVKNEMDKIDKINKAMQLYQSLQKDEKKIDAVLLLFKKDITIYESEDSLDKLIEIHNLYNLNDTNLNLFINYVKDANWEYKYLINLAVEKEKLINPVNSSVFYYNNTLIGRTIDEAVLYLQSGNEDATNILNTIQTEVNYKIK
jgi:hypothetical protein